MSLMLGKLYDSLVDAGSTPAKAQEAATEVAAYENRIAKVEGDLSILKWMVGFNIALSVTILTKLFV